MNGAAKNTDKEIWRKIPGDVYSPSIHVTERGDIGIQVGGRVIVLPIEAWFTAAAKHHEGIGHRQLENAIGMDLEGNELVKGPNRRIIYTPPVDSHYTGMLSGIYYVNGNQVSEAEFREDVIGRALKRAEELKKD